MLYLLVASFFYSGIIYRLPVGTYGHFFLSDLLGIVFIIYMLERKLITGEKLQSVDKQLFTILCFTAIWMAISLIPIYFRSSKTLFSELGRASFDVAHFFEYLLIYYAVYKYPVHTKRNLRKYFYFIIIISAFVSICGIFTDVILDIPRYYRDVAKDVLRPNEELTAFFTANRGCAGLFFYIAMTITLSLLMISKRFIGKISLGFAMLLFMASVILTTSRSAILATTVFILSFIVIYQLKNKFNFTTTITSFFILALSLSTFLGVLYKTPMEKRLIGTIEMFSGETSMWQRGPAQEAVITRLDNWKKAIKFSTDSVISFLKGYGVHQEGFLTGYSSAHNNYLQFLVDLGFVGLLLFLLFLSKMAFIYIAGMRSTDLEISKVSIGLLAGLIGLIVTCMTMETFYMMPAMGNFMPFYLIIVALAQKYIQMRE